jgi:hypothetical protein
MSWPSPPSPIMIEKLPHSAGNILAFKMTGKLHDEDYKQFVPIVEMAIQAYGKVRLLAEFADFHGWDLHALWDDIKSATTHCADVERVALVGDQKWEEWMARICRPFAMAKLRYFDARESITAWIWLTRAD